MEIFFVIVFFFFACNMHQIKDQPGWYTFNEHRNYVVHCKKIEQLDCGVSLLECNDKQEHYCLTNVTYQKGDPSDQKFKR